MGSELDLRSEADTGYHFESYTAAGSTPEWEGGSRVKKDQRITVTGKTQIDAHFVANKYKAAFHPNYTDSRFGTEYQDMVYDEPQNLFRNSHSRYGYEFAGWTATPQWTGKTYQECETVQNLTTEDNGTFDLYAQWNPVQSYIEYNANGAEGTMQSQKVFFDAKTQLAPNEFTKKYYTFTGWNTRRDGLGRSYEPEDVYVSANTVKDSSVRLYAQWALTDYRISYVMQGGVNPAENPTVYTYETDTFTLKAPAREGYTFTGWTGSNGDKPQKKVTIAKGSDGDRTYIANWKSDGKDGGRDDDKDDGKNGGRDDSSDTGDNARTGLLISIMLAALAVAAGVSAALRRRRC